MDFKKKAVFNWSGGKDSALALQIIQENDAYDVISLFTAMNKQTGKSSIHGLPFGVLSAQAHSMGIPIYCHHFEDNLADYQQQMQEVVNHFKRLGVTHFIFGDIAMADIKNFRESNLNPEGIEVVAPLWDNSSDNVMDDFLNSEIKAKIIVTQADKLDHSYIGRDLDRETIASFPEGIDKCGENGEYHSLVFDGRIFNEPVQFTLGDTMLITYDIRLDNGQVRRYEYWQAEITS